MTMNETERQIVAWLRKEASFWLNGAGLSLLVRFRTAWRVLLFPQGPYYAALYKAAESIERGEHRDKQDG